MSYKGLQLTLKLLRLDVRRFVILILLLLTILFSILSVTVPNYYETEGVCAGILTSMMKGTPCLGECPTGDLESCDKSSLCIANIVLPFIVVLCMLASVGFLFAPTKEFVGVIMASFVGTMVSIAAIIIQTQSPHPDTKNVSMSSVASKVDLDDGTVYSMGFSFSILTIIFGVLSLLGSMIVIRLLK